MWRLDRVVSGLLAVGALAGAAVATDAAALSTTYSYDAAAATTTSLANTRTDAQRARPGSRTASRSSPSRIGAVRAAKAVRPTASDARLGRALADDYRGGPNPIGDGSALDAARHTVKTGDLVGGSTHLEKVVEMRDRYGRIIRRAGFEPG